LYFNYSTINFRRNCDVVSTLGRQCSGALLTSVAHIQKLRVFCPQATTDKDRQARCGDQLQGRTCHLRTAIAGGSAQVPTAQCRIFECLHLDAQCPENCISLTLTGSCRVTTGTATVEGKVKGHPTIGLEGPEWE